MKTASIWLLNIARRYENANIDSCHHHHHHHHSSECESKTDAIDDENEQNKKQGQYFRSCKTTALPIDGIDGGRTMDIFYFSFSLIRFNYYGFL